MQFDTRTGSVMHGGINNVGFDLCQVNSKYAELYIMYAESTNYV